MPALRVAQQRDLCVGASFDVVSNHPRRLARPLSQGVGILVEGGRIVDGLGGRPGNGQRDVPRNHTDLPESGFLGAAARNDDVEALGALLGPLDEGEVEGVCARCEGEADVHLHVGDGCGRGLEECRVPVPASWVSGRVKTAPTVPSNQPPRTEAVLVWWSCQDDWS